MAEVSRAEGLLMGGLANLAALAEDVVKTSEIEGEPLKVEPATAALLRMIRLP